MSDPRKFDLSPEMSSLLERHIDAARKVDEAALSQAASQFRANLPTARPRRRPVLSWMRMAGVAAALVLAVSLVPLLLPGKPGASAFAEAQAWFESYRTLQFVMTMTQEDRELTTVSVWTDEAGATRIETPPITHIVLPRDNVMHTLMPNGQVMSRSLGPVPGPFNLGEGMEWLDELVTFQGMAELLDETRPVDGIDARGWRLELTGGTHTLWVDPADNRPLRLEAELEGDLRLTSVFTFDEPLPATLFELPSTP